MMEDKSVIVIGAGGHAKVLIEILLLCKVDILGIVDVDVSKLGMEIFGVKVVGDDSIIGEYHPKEIALVNAVGSVKSMRLRAAIYNKFKEKKYSFCKVVHPSALVSSFAKLAEGVQVMAGAVIQSDSVIGENTIINTNASVDHECIVGNHVHIAPGCILSGGVTIGAHSHVGAGAVIIQGKIVGANALIGAGAVVLKDITANTTAFGVPAREVHL